MRLHRLEIEGYRGFDHKVIIDFPEGNAPMVLVGVNGSGKTAVLEGIVGSIEVLQVGLTSSLPKTHTANDVNNSNKSSICRLDWYFDNNEYLETGFEYENYINFERKYIGLDLINSLVKKLKQIAKKTPDILQKKGVPICTYYPTHRTLYNSQLQTHDDIKVRIFDSWDEALSGGVNYTDFFRWFRNREDIENERIRHDDKEYLDNQIEAVRLAISSILQGFSKPRVKRSSIARLVINKDGQELSLNQLSYGEKMLLALVGDIARRLALANPSLENPLEGKGVILIDELDLHLHPSWQRTIVTKLTETFPNIQFVVTTHSELVISHVKKESIYLLKDNQVIPWKDEAFNPYGAEPEDVLKIIQGVDQVLPDEVTNKFKQLFDLIDKDDFEAAKRLKGELEELVDMQHPSLLRAETNMELKTLIG